MRYFQPAIFSLLCASAWAQTAPDAGALLRQTEQGLKLQTPPAAVSRRAPPPPPMAKLDQATVTVQRFVFAGNTLVDSATLSQALSSYLNRPLSFDELQAAAAVVTQTYRDAGWLVTAYLPKQEIQNGQVTIQIIEAVFGKASVQDPQPQRMAAQRLVDIFNAQQTPGQPLNAQRVDRALLLLDDLPGVMVSGNLQAGTSAHETDMALSVIDEPLLKGDIGGDNNGSIPTGVTRTSLNASLNSPLWWGDQLQLNAIRTRGSEYTRLAYSVPVGNDGWRAQVRGSGLNYHLIGDLAATDGHGRANTTGAELSYPLLRSQTSNLNALLGFDAKNYDNYNATGITSRYNTRVSSVALSGNHIDTSGGTHQYGINWISGKLTSQVGTQNEGRYQRLGVNLSRLQPLSTDTQLSLAYAMQVANANLDSSEKLYLEGPSGVRAYANGATRLGGSEGQTFTAELRHNLDMNWRLNGFYDYGKARVNRYNYQADGTTPLSVLNDFQIRGYGFSLGWQNIQGIDLKATVAKRIGLNPNATAQGMDQDGSYKNPRYWVSATVAF
jgi:hemolysin activation/secretion protein